MTNRALLSSDTYFVTASYFATRYQTFFYLVTKVFRPTTIAAIREFGELVEKRSSDLLKLTGSYFILKPYKSMEISNVRRNPKWLKSLEERNMSLWFFLKRQYTLGSKQTLNYLFANTTKHCGKAGVTSLICQSEILEKNDCQNIFRPETETCLLWRWKFWNRIWFPTGCLSFQTEINLTDIMCSVNFKRNRKLYETARHDTHFKEQIFFLNIPELQNKPFFTYEWSLS